MTQNKITEFDFPEGKIINQKYKIISKLGGGYEGEVYKVEEKSTNIVRAAKFFLPQRNLKNQSAKQYAKKLHKLRHCSILIRYMTQEVMRYKGHDITFLISDFVEGETLSQFLKKFRGNKLPPYQALQLIHAIVSGLEEVHAYYEYHGDLHTDNVIIQKYGLGFEVKLLDMFHYGTPKSQDFRDDVCDVVKLFHEILGGAKTYAAQPDEIKDICSGLKKSLIIGKFRNLSILRIHIENMEWSEYK